MYRRFLFVSLCFISILFSSCIKTLEEEGIYESTRCHGVVLDERTHQPVQGLRVVCADGWNFSNIVYTAADGSFEIDVTLDQLTKDYVVRVESDSLYESFECSLSDVPLGAKEYDLGVIYLAGPNVPIVVTRAVIEITAVSVHCFGAIDNTGNSAIIEQGFVYSTMQYPTINSEKISLPVGSGDFDYILELEPHTTYYVRAYAKNSIGVGYSDQVVVTTLSGLPDVSTGTVFNITTTSATCGGEVLADGSFSILERGVCWSTSAEPTISNAHTANGVGLGSFVCQMNSLEPNTTYRVRAYARNAAGIAYGSVVTFTTQSGLPTVITTTVSNITSTSAVAGGMVEADGGYPVIRRGVCYGTSSQPTITGLHTTDGAGTGSFVSNLTNLTPGSTYYYRAYATNGVGTVYGNQQVFVAW